MTTESTILARLRQSMEQMDVNIVKAASEDQELLQEDVEESELVDEQDEDNLDKEADDSSEAVDVTQFIGDMSVSELLQNEHVSEGVRKGMLQAIRESL